MFDIEGVGHVRTCDEVLVFLDLDPRIALAPFLGLLEQLVDFGSGVEEEPQMVVARAFDVLLLLGDKDELAGVGVGAQQQTDLAEDRDVHRIPTKQVGIELRDLAAALLEAAERERQLHVIEARGHRESSGESGL